MAIVFNPEGSTKKVAFAMRRPTYAPAKSHVVLNPQHDSAAVTDLWECQAAAHLDAHTRV